MEMAVEMVFVCVLCF